MLFENKERNFYKRRRSIQVGGTIISLDKPIVMGILNCTPDSFFDGGKYLAKETIRERAQRIIDEGASIIDIGAYSSRPGADDVSEKIEIERLTNAMETIRKHFPDFPISIDTFRSSVAEYICSNFGSVIINDISGGNIDPKMFETVAKLRVPYIMMHMRGTPKTMQEQCEYKNLTMDIILELSKKTAQARKLGISDIILDPGFGFSKTLDQNFELLNQMDAFKLFELPLLVGISRKSMIWKTLNSTPDKSLAGTITLNTFALQQGASILRVHDVKEAVDTVELFEKMKKATINN